MKIDITLSADMQINPANEQSLIAIKKLKFGHFYTCDIKLNNNYRLHQKIFGFFVFCTNYYYGDMDASKCPYQVERLRKKLTIAAGYHKQVFNRDGIHFEIVALSLKFESMPDDERQVFYKRMTQAALDNVFNNGADDNVINQLLTWF